MTEPRMYINFSFDGYIKLSDFLKIAPLLEQETYYTGKSDINETQEIINRQRSADIDQLEKAGRVNAPEFEQVEEVIAPQPAIDVEIDINGIPFDPALHTGTKKKDGTWRMKKGAVETPSSISTASPASETADTATAPAGSLPTEEPASAPASQAEDDEFAAFAAAAAKADAVEANVPERVWTDADLGALCNQAAIKLDNPAPVKEQIAKFVPEGEVAHSRNVPADKRAEFVKTVEAAAGIEFAG